MWRKSLNYIVALAEVCVEWDKESVPCQVFWTCAEPQHSRPCRAAAASSRPAQPGWLTKIQIDRFFFNYFQLTNDDKYIFKMHLCFVCAGHYWDRVAGGRAGGRAGRAGRSTAMLDRLAPLGLSLPARPPPGLPQLNQVKTH